MKKVNLTKLALLGIASGSLIATQAHANNANESSVLLAGGGCGNGANSYKAKNGHSCAQKNNATAQPSTASSGHKCGGGNGCGGGNQSSTTNGSSDQMVDKRANMQSQASRNNNRRGGQIAETTPSNLPTNVDSSDIDDENDDGTSEYMMNKRSTDAANRATTSTTTNPIPVRK